MLSVAPPAEAKTRITNCPKVLRSVILKSPWRYPIINCVDSARSDVTGTAAKEYVVLLTYFDPNSDSGDIPLTIEVFTPTKKGWRPVAAAMVDTGGYNDERISSISRGLITVTAPYGMVRFRYNGTDQLQTEYPNS
jgi:hypothetical protein